MSIPKGSVWLDARGIQSVGHAGRGIARYVAEHAEAVLELAPEAVGTVSLDPGLPVPAEAEALSASGKVIWPETGMPAGAAVPPIYHVMSPFEAERELDDIWPQWVRQGSRLVVTLYDLVPLIMRDQYLAEWGYWATAWIARLGLTRAADQVLTISQQTADDAIEHLGLSEERITVIDSGVSDRISAMVGSRAKAESLLAKSMRKLRPGFLLYVGGTDFRKNLEGTIRAYARLPESLRSAHQRVIACNVSPLRRHDLKALARSLGIDRTQILLTGYVSGPELAALYRTCELFIFPSLYEGAGLPILEAMSCGAPVAASGVSAMPELLGDLEATFDPADPGDMARCLREVLETPGQLDSLRERSRRQVELHTWARVAEKTVEGYQRALRSPVAAGT